MQGEGATRAVFVDATGRRSRVVARTCWTLGALLVAYVALVVVSLLLPPGMSRLTVPGLGPVLPGPGAAVLGAGEREDDAETPEVLLAPSPAVSRASRPTLVPQAPAAPTPRTAPRPSPRASAAPARSPRPDRTAAPRSTRAPGASDPTTEPTRKPTREPGEPAATRGPKPRPTPTRGPR